MQSGLQFSTVCPPFHEVQQCHSILFLILHVYAVAQGMRIVTVHVIFYFTGTKDVFLVLPLCSKRGMCKLVLYTKNQHAFQTTIFIFPNLEQHIPISN